MDDANNLYEIELNRVYEELARLKAENIRLKTNQSNELMTLAHIAQLTGLSERALKVRIGKGELRAVCLSSTEFRVQHSDYEAWLDTMFTMGQNKDGWTRQSAHPIGSNHEQQKEFKNQNAKRDQQTSQWRIQNRHDGDVSTHQKTHPSPRDATIRHDSQTSDCPTQHHQGGHSQQTTSRRAPNHTAEAHTRGIRQRMASKKSASS